MQLAWAKTKNKKKIDLGNKITATALLFMVFGPNLYA